MLTINVLNDHDIKLVMESLKTNKSYFINKKSSDAKFIDVAYLRETAAEFDYFIINSIGTYSSNLTFFNNEKEINNSVFMNYNIARLLK